MKKETFKNAQVLNSRIEQLKDCIYSIEHRKENCTRLLNFHWCHDGQIEDEMKTIILNWLKKELKKSELEFEELK